MFGAGRFDGNIADVPDILIHAISQLAGVVETDKVTRHIKLGSNPASKVRRNPIGCAIGPLARYQQEIGHIYANPKPSCRCQ